MKQMVIVLTLFVFLSPLAVADSTPKLLAQDIEGTPLYANYAYSPEGRTLAYVWENFAYAERRDTMLITVSWNKKGTFKASKPVVISSMPYIFRPDIAYNPETKRFLAVWVSRDANGREYPRARILAANGKPVGGIVTLYDEITTYGQIVTTAQTKAHMGDKIKGDFLVQMRTPYTSFDVLEFDSKKRSGTILGIKANQYFSAFDMITLNNGRIFVIGDSAYNTSSGWVNNVAVASYGLSGGNVLISSISSDLSSSTEKRLTAISNKLMVASWPDTTDSAYLANIRLIKATGKPKGGAKVVFDDESILCQQFAVANDGRVFGLAVGKNYRTCRIYSMSPKGKIGKVVQTYTPGQMNTNYVAMIHIEEQNKLFLLYFAYGLVGSDMYGILLDPEE